MENRDFIEAVRTMRHWQKTYFRTRDPRAMSESIKYEKQVDQMLVELEQPDLFKQ